MPALGRILVTPADLGRKVSLRYLANNQPTDALGELVGFLDARFLVKTKLNQIKEVNIQNLIAAKVVPPERSAAWVEENALQVWQAHETQTLGDWYLQASGGQSTRVNSCLLVGMPNQEISQGLKSVIEWYQKRELIPTVHLSAPGVFDQALEKAGFTKTRLINFMTKKVSKQKVESSIKISKDLQDDWFEAVNASTHDGRGVSRHTLQSGDWVRYLSVAVDQKIIATARIGAVKDFALITNLWVDPTFRQKGIAQNLMKELENQAFAEGIEQIWLQVLSTNQSAINLYEKLGFNLHHQYQYWAYLVNTD